MSELRLTPQAFAILSALIEETAGLSYTLADKEIFESKVCTRAVDAGFDSVLDYYYFLRYDDNGRTELDALIEALVVHETFFFRELEPLQVIIDKFVLPLVESGARPRIWCAAASTGEEPLTIAMLLTSKGVFDRVDLIASDISAAVLTRARNGQYSPRTLRRTPVPAFAVPFIQATDQGVSVSKELREAIQWRRLNLIDPLDIRSVGPVDVILCRNVLIYFRDELAQRIVRHLTEQLRPEGVLLVGVSESLMRFGTALRCEEHGGTFVYRKSSS